MDGHEQSGGPSDPPRRDFLRTVGSTASATVITGCASVRPDSPEAIAAASNIEGAVPITLRINGKDHPLRIDPRTTLLDCIRETVALTGTKKGCDHGQCGACTVHVNGRRVNSCLSLALLHDGAEITTIEGLGTPDELHPMQAAFLAHDGYQCGYCTSGQIMSAVARSEEHTSELQHTVISYAVFCLKKKKPESPKAKETEHALALRLQMTTQ